MMESTYFPNIEEADLSDQASATLRCIRTLLVASRPPNVRPHTTFVRGETHGDDFALPHSEFDGFGLVIRVGASSRGAVIAYSGCRRPDRGDEFDAAFDPARKEMTAVIEGGEKFCGDLTEALLRYLRRKLQVVQEVGRGKGNTLETQILWPPTEKLEHDVPPLWTQRSGMVLLRSTEEIRSLTAFDEQKAV